MAQPGHFGYAQIVAWLRAASVLAIFMSAGGVATADRKTIIKDTSDNFVVVTTTYAHGKSLRWESEVLVPGDPQRPVANILNADRGASYVLDLNAREYVAPRSAEPILTLAMWLHRPRISSSGKTVRIYSEAVDTGERRQMFGLTARHLIIHQRTTAEAGACSCNSTLERDGWYVPAVSASAYQGTFLVAVGQRAGIISSPRARGLNRDLLSRKEKRGRLSIERITDAGAIYDAGKFSSFRTGRSTPACLNLLRISCASIRFLGSMR
jgi:hypothetical protein